MVSFAQQSTHEEKGNCCLATSEVTLPETAQEHLTIKNPNVVDRMTMMALEVAAKRGLTFHKSVRRMPSSQNQLMWAGMKCCVFDPHECS